MFTIVIIIIVPIISVDLFARDPNEPKLAEQYGRVSQKARAAVHPGLREVPSPRPPLHPCSGLHSCCRKPTSYLVKGHSADLAARKETNTSSVPCLNCTFLGTQTDAP